MELRKFYNSIELQNDKLVKYEDAEGNVSIFPIAGLLCKCEFLKVDKDRLNVMKFNQEVDKEMKFNVIDETVPYVDPKNKTHITNKTIKVNEMWKISNGIGFSQIFNNKEEALALVNDINNKYLDKVNI